MNQADLVKTSSCFANGHCLRRYARMKKATVPAAMTNTPDNIKRGPVDKNIHSQTRITAQTGQGKNGILNGNDCRLRLCCKTNNHRAWQIKCTRMRMAKLEVMITVSLNNRQ